MRNKFGLIFRAQLVFGAVVLFSPIAKSESAFLNDITAIATATARFQELEAKTEALNANRTAKAWHWIPRFDLAVSRSYTAAATGSDTSTSQADSGGLTASLNLFSGGKGLALHSAADKALQSFQAEQQEISLKLEETAAQAIFQALQIQEQLKMQERLVNIKKESLRVVREKYQRGQTPLQDVQKAEVDLSQAETRKRGSQIQAIEFNNSIKDYLNRALTTVTWPFSSSTKLKKMSPRPHPSQLHFDLQAESLKELYRAESDGQWPALDLTYQYLQNGFSTNASAQNLTSLTLTFPLWDRGERRAQIAKAFSEYRSAELAANFNKSYVQNRTNSQDEKLRLAKENLLQTTDNLGKSKQLYDDTVKNFRLGRTSVNDLLLEQARLLDVEQSYLSQLMNFHGTYVETCHLQGQRLQECLED